MSCFFVIGNDKRTLNIKEMLKKDDKVVDEILNANYVLAPTPFTKDNEYILGTEVLCSDIINMCKNKILFAGAIPNSIKEKLDKNNIKYYDLMEYEEIAILNAIPTAEGAIEVAMEMSDITLCGSKVLVLGYGRIGKVLSKMLHGIGAKIYCEARKEKDLALINTMGYNSVDLSELDSFLPCFDYIFNTVPDMILDRKRLDKVKEEVCIIDVASNPGGVDFSYAESKNIKTNLALALPSKVAPKSAARYFKDKIDKIIQNIK